MGLYWDWADYMCAGRVMPTMLGLHVYIRRVNVLSVRMLVVDADNKMDGQLILPVSLILILLCCLLCVAGDSKARRLRTAAGEFLRQLARL